jgi:hypothetical protein
LRFTESKDVVEKGFDGLRNDMILTDGEKITTEITEKQRKILDALQMSA